MNRTLLLSLCTLCLCGELSAAAEPTYWQDIRPLFRRHCIVCHSAKNLGELDVSGGLALDSFEAVKKGAKKPVLHPGKSGDSSLVTLLRDKDEKKRMPLGAPPLPEEAIALIRNWVDTGAKEGTRPDVVEAPAVTTPPRTRKLDVLLPTTATPPAGLLSKGAAARLDLVLPVGPLAPVAAVTFSPDGKLLATGAYGRVTIWDLATVQPVKVLTNVLGAVNDLKFSPDGKLLAVGGGQPSARGDLRVYEVQDWKLIATLPGHADVVACVVFSADGKHLASASFDKTVRVWDVASHKLLQTLTGHSDFVYSVAFGPDGKWLVSASKDRSVKLVEWASGKSVFTFSGMNEDVLAVTVSPDGKQVISSGFDTALFCWNPQNGARVRAQGGHGTAVHELAFSKDGQFIVSAAADRTVRLWNGTTGAPVRTMTVGSIAYAVAISPDGKRIASGSFDGLVRFWDTASGRHLVSLLSLPPEKEAFDWLAQTPEGYAAGSDRLIAAGKWRMAAQAVEAERVWKALRRLESILQAARGDAVVPPKFE